MPATHPLAPFRRGVSRVLRRRPRLTDAMDWMYRLSVITITRRHPPIYVKGRPYFVSKENPSNRLPRLHCSRSRSWEASYFFRHAHGHAYAAGGRRVSTSTYPRRKRCRHPRPHCALEASASSDPGTLYETAGSITSHRPSSDPPSHSERFDARLLRSVHRSHDQRNTQAAPSQSGSPSLRDVFA